MRSIIILLVIIAYFIPRPIYPQGNNPFASMLPKEIEPEKPKKGEGPEKKLPTLDLDELSVEGIFWGTGMPQAIINGEVYKERERIEEVNAEIVKIEKGSVKVLYGGRVYVLSIKK